MVHDNLAGLIIPAKSGVTYTQQACGLSCQHPELEGSYVPCVYHFNEIPHVGCTMSLGSAEAVELNDFFEKSHAYRGLTVDPGMLKESMEAWIWVLVGPDYQVLDGYTGPAVLTYPNCD